MSNNNPALENKVEQDDDLRGLADEALKDVVGGYGSGAIVGGLSQHQL